MTIWIFGDYSPININDDENILSLNGTALEYAYMKFNDARNKIKSNDKVIVYLTNFDRRWFFKNFPEYAELDISPNNIDKENKAIQLFRKYLDHKELHHVYLIDFLYNLHSLTEELNLSTILIPKFKDIEKFLNKNIELFPLFTIIKDEI